MAIQIRLGTCTEDPRKLDKAPNFELSSPRSVTAQIKDNCSIMAPAFLLSASLVEISQYNFLHVPSWGRYYFIKNLIAVTGSQIMIQAAEDVLTSNAAAIAALQINIQRAEQSDAQNRMIRDGLLPLQANRQCETITFDRSPFSANYATDKIYLLTVLGGTANDS